MTSQSGHAVRGSISTSTREAVIVSELAANGRVEISPLAKHLGVSDMTIRRDLDRLASTGALIRVRGGATAVGPEPFGQRFARQSSEKQRIADKMFNLVGEGDTIALDASTTVQRLAYLLGDVNGLTVLTNGPDTFLALRSHASVTAILTGGQLDRRTGSLVGPVAVASTKHFAMKYAFVSAAALDVQFGTTEQTLEDAEAKSAMAAASASVVLGIDHSKIDRRSSARGIPLDGVDFLVTDLDPQDARLDAFRKSCRIL